MPVVNLVKATFTSGVLDERALSRTDIAHYERGLQRGRNCIVTPFGGARRRGGLEWISMWAESGGGRLVPFDVAIGSRRFVLLFTDGAIRICSNSAIMAALNGGGESIATPYPASALRDLRFAQSEDVLFIVHPDYEPRALANFYSTTFTADAGTDVLACASATGFALDAPVTFGTTGTLPAPLAVGTYYYAIPQSPGESGQHLKLAAAPGGPAIDITSAGTGTHTITGAGENNWSLSTIDFSHIPQIDYDDALSPVPVPEIQTIVLSDVHEGEAFKLDLEGAVTEPISVTTDADTNCERIAQALSYLYNTGSGEISVSYIAANTYQVSFNGGAARAYGLMAGFASYGSMPVAVTRNQVGVSRSEPAWSALRGYPRTVCFYAGRLIFGGTRSKSQTVFMSAVNDFYNFDIGKGIDDDAIIRTLDTDRQTAIMAVVPGRDLQVLTESAEFFCHDNPITPEKSAFLPQTTYGAANVSPVQLDGMTWFLDRTGASLRQFVYSDVEAAYTAPSASKLAPSLLRAPVAMAAVQSSRDDAASQIYVVNADGTAAVMHTERAEDMVAAWTSWDTAGGVFDVCALRDEVCFIARRELESGAVLTLESLRTDRYLDFSATYTGVAGLTKNVNPVYNGIEVMLRADSQPAGVATPSGGVVALPWVAQSVEVGLPFRPEIQPMPAAIITQNVAAVNRRARLRRCFVRVHETLGLKCNGYRQESRFLNVTPLDTAPTAVSGVLEFRLAGWEAGQAPLITQDEPNPLHVLGMEYEVEMH